MSREQNRQSDAVRDNWSEQERACRIALAHLKQLQLRSMIVAMSTSEAVSRAARHYAPASPSSADHLSLILSDAA